MTEPRKLVLISNFPPDRQESMQRFADVLSGGFQARGRRVEVWAPQPRFARWVREYRYAGVPKYLGYLDKFVRFPRWLRSRLRQEPPEAVFHIIDHSNAVYAPEFRRRPLLVTCHDLLQIRAARGEFPEQGVSRTGRIYQDWVLKRLSQVPRAVCVSAKTQEDLRRLTGLPEDRTPRIYMGLNFPYVPLPADTALRRVNELLRRAGAGPVGAPGAYFLGVGGAQWYKNRTGLVAIFAELRRSGAGPDRLLLVGPPLDPEQTELLAQANLTGAVARLSGVSNEDLQALYSAAAALIFPSWEEGFGWPVAEAQACGCPVFTSNRAPMTEVGGSAAGYLDPADPRDAARVIADALPKLDTMRAAGLEQACRWDTAKMLESYEQQYSTIAQEPASLAAVGS